MRLIDIVNEYKNSKLEKEYSMLKKKAFVSKQDLKRIEEIERELKINPDRWNKSTKAKFKKSHRVTSFNRTRS